MHSISCTSLTLGSALYQNNLLAQVPNLKGLEAALECGAKEVKKLMLVMEEKLTLKIG